MHFDDRLATVLRARTGGTSSARTQFRQLADLLGTLPSGARGDDSDAAWVRLAELSDTLDPADRAAALSEPGLRLRSPRLVADLARQDGEVAVAAVKAAHLSENEWLDLIPALPPPVRPLLRQRADLGDRVEALLNRLGVARAGLPPAGRASRMAANDTQGAAVDGSVDGIGAIVQRIEAYRRRRAEADARGEPRAASEEPSITTAFACNERGEITWVEGSAAPALVGMRIVARDASAAVTSRPGLASAFNRRMPILREPVSIAGAPAISGDWLIDAYPRFDTLGRFTGYEGRLRRPPPLSAQSGHAANGEADRLRQLLHELRTPVNAIQGFAEVIQQQLFGPTPHEYRAHAAAIAGDAARMLAGFDDLERLARLTTGAMTLDPGHTDLGAVILATARQLEAHTSARDCGFALEAEALPQPIALDSPEAERLAWRLLATLAGAAAPGERLRLRLDADSAMARVSIALPKVLADQADIFHAAASPSPTPLSAGMFGAGFALRLAASEARAGGGSLERRGEWLDLAIPLAPHGLTEPQITESKGIAG